MTPPVAAVQLAAPPDANRRAAVQRELYSFASPVRAGELQTLDDRMDILALLEAVFDIGDLLSTRRVTVKDRYEMKKKVRELRKRERQAARNKSSPNLDK